MERMGRMRVASIGMAMAALTLGLTSPALGATSNGSLAGGEEWPMFIGRIHSCGCQRSGRTFVDGHQLDPQEQDGILRSGNVSCCRERWNHLPIAERATC